MLKVGTQCPDFQGYNQNGKEISNSSLKGGKFIMFFYPKDMTPGCTIEVCNLRDNYDVLRSKGFQIYGVSADSEKRHLKFIDKHDLPFDLIVDEKKEIIQAFEVWGRKKFMGKEYDGIFRTTFGIDEAGKILFIIDKVKTKNHSQQILDAIEK